MTSYGLDTPCAVLHKFHVNFFPQKFLLKIEYERSLWKGLLVDYVDLLSCLNYGIPYSSSETKAKIAGIPMDRVTDHN